MDLRPSNLVSYGSDLLPIDYGSIMPASTQPQLYHGTTSHASDKVLQFLAEGKTNFTVSRADDLHCLLRTVRTLVALDQNDFKSSLKKAKKDKRIQFFWARKLSGWWEPASKMATDVDYDALAKFFEETINLA